MNFSRTGPRGASESLGKEGKGEAQPLEAAYHNSFVCLGFERGWCGASSSRMLCLVMRDLPYDGYKAPSTGSLLWPSCKQQHLVQTPGSNHDASFLVGQPCYTAQGLCQARCPPEKGFCQAGVIRTPCCTLARALLKPLPQAEQTRSEGSGTFYFVPTTGPGLH